MSEIFAEQLTVKEVFADDLEREVEVRGQSMRLLIENGETVIVQRTKPEALALGDIILFRKDKQFILHRVIYKIRKNGQAVFITKGDTHPSFDTPVGEEEIIGKVTAIKKYGGTITLTSRLAKLLNYFIWTCSLLPYLLSKVFTLPFEILFDSFLGTISLVHQIAGPLSKTFHRVTASVYVTKFRIQQWKDTWLRHLHASPAFLVNIYAKCFLFIPRSAKNEN